MRERLRATWQAHPWTLLRIGGTLLFLSLILAYNWSHTAGLLARYASAGFGPVAALGIEGLVAVMSFRLGLSRRAGRQERMTVAVLVSVLVVSAVANLLMGHEIAGQGNALTWETMQAVDIIQGVGWVMATALLSLVAYFAADTVANDVAGLVAAPAPVAPYQQAQRDGAALEPLHDDTPTAIEAPTCSTTSDDAALPTKRQRVFALLDMTRGAASNADVAQQCDVSESTARSYRAQWQTRNSERVVEVEAVAHNGNGAH